MALDFKKVGDGIDAGESIEVESLLAKSTEVPRTDGVDVNFFPGSNGRFAGSEETILLRGLLGSLAMDTRGDHVIDFSAETGMMEVTGQCVHESSSTSSMDGEVMVSPNEIGQDGSGNHNAEVIIGEDLADNG